jgi:hypothetical protein
VTFTDHYPRPSGLNDASVDTNVDGRQVLFSWDNLSSPEIGWNQREKEEKKPIKSLSNISIPPFPATTILVPFEMNLTPIDTQYK